MITEKEFKELFCKATTECDRVYGADTPKDAITWYWNGGGASGGSCWDEADDEGAVPYDGEEEPTSDTTPLWSFLCKAFPAFEVAKKLSGEHETWEYRRVLKNTEEDDHSENEFYGNYTDYRIRYITYERLLAALVELGYVECASI